MAGKGGYKHRKRKLDRKRTQREQKARANIDRIQNQFEKRGQTWEPESNSQQMAALNHAARRMLAKTDYDRI